MTTASSDDISGLEEHPPELQALILRKKIIEEWQEKEWNRLKKNPRVAGYMNLIPKLRIAFLALIFCNLPIMLTIFFLEVSIIFLEGYILVTLLYLTITFLPWFYLDTKVHRTVSGLYNQYVMFLSVVLLFVLAIPLFVYYMILSDEVSGIPTPIYLMIIPCITMFGGLIIDFVNGGFARLNEKLELEIIKRMKLEE